MSGKDYIINNKGVKSIFSCTYFKKRIQGLKRKSGTFTNIAECGIHLLTPRSLCETPSKPAVNMLGAVLAQCIIAWSILPIFIVCSGVRLCVCPQQAIPCVNGGPAGGTARQSH